MKYLSSVNYNTTHTHTLNPINSVVIAIRSTCFPQSPSQATLCRLIYLSIYNSIWVTMAAECWWAARLTWPQTPSEMSRPPRRKHYVSMVGCGNANQYCLQPHRSSSGIIRNGVEGVGKFSYIGSWDLSSRLTCDQSGKDNGHEKQDHRVSVMICPHRDEGKHCVTHWFPVWLEIHVLRDVPDPLVTGQREWQQIIRNGNSAELILKKYSTLK